MASVITERITKTPGVCGGKACIAGHRVRVMDIVIRHEFLGLSADEIVAQLPSITLGDVYAALAYYFDHIEEIREEMRQEEEFVADFMQKHPSALDAKLKKLRGEDGE
ncbi:MAG TPA: DUF433 domain-containing protein [Blastocatellia bacterium]|nr:DUF433 domain-containing protein [Blastocatellia bacterium]